MPNSSFTTRLSIIVEVEIDAPPQHGGDVVFESKVFNMNLHRWVKDDGETMATFRNINLTLLHIRETSGNTRVDVIGDFYQYNNTQNDKGTHHASLRFSLLGQADNVIAVPYSSVFITRDVCRDLGRKVLPQVQLPSDIYGVAQGFEMSGQASWNYEGGC